MFAFQLKLLETLFTFAKKFIDDRSYVQRELLNNLPNDQKSVLKLFCKYLRIWTHLLTH